MRTTASHNIGVAQQPTLAQPLWWLLTEYIQQGLWLGCVQGHKRGDEGMKEHDCTSSEDIGSDDDDLEDEWRRKRKRLGPTRRQQQQASRKRQRAKEADSPLEVHLRCVFMCVCVHVSGAGMGKYRLKGVFYDRVLRFMVPQHKTTLRNPPFKVMVP